MNILLLNDSSALGGGEIWCLRFSIRMRARGHRIYFACPRNSRLHEEAGRVGIESLLYDAHDRFDIIGFSSLFLSFMKDKKIDLIFGTIVGNFSEAQFLYTVLDMLGDGTAVLKTGLTPWKGITAAQYGHGYEEYVKKLVVVSDAVKREILEQFNEIAPDYIAVSYGGVDLNEFDPRRYAGLPRPGSLRSELGVPDDFLMTAVISRLLPWKGHTYLLSVLDSIRAEHPKIRLLIIGEGPERGKIEKVVKKLGLKKHVTFLGYRENIAEILSQIDILIHPSFKEGLPNVIEEAMAMEKPVIAVNSGGLSELIEHGRNGLLVGPDDRGALINGILTLLKDRGMRERMGAAARKRIMDHFNIDEKVAELEAILLDLKKTSLSRVAE